MGILNISIGFFPEKVNDKLKEKAKTWQNQKLCFALYSRMWYNLPYISNVHHCIK